MGDKYPDFDPYYSEITQFSLEALRYFIESLKLSQKSVLQDMLRILKIMTDFDKDQNDYAINRTDESHPDYHLAEMINSLHDLCDPERWLKVIPQLIAIMDMKNVDVVPCKSTSQSEYSTYFP